MTDRKGNANPVYVVLLSGIFVALVVLAIVLALNGRTDQATGASAELVASDGSRIGRSDLSNPPPSPKRPVGNPDRIKETLQAGKTYQVLLKAGLDARVEDKDWGLKQVVTLAYAAEMLVNRTIESNDGKRIVELRHFEQCRNFKLLCDVESVSIELGPEGMLALGALDYLRPGAGKAILAAKPLVEMLLKVPAQSSINEATSKAFGQVDGISGKRVRITYVDGVGVESLEPVGCSLTAGERDFLFGTAVLSDCYMLPDVTIPVGQSWRVEGSTFAGLLDPTWRGIPEGEVVVIREPDQTSDGKRFAALRIQSGFLHINASDSRARRIGTFEPKGTLQYSLDDSYVTSATLSGRMTIERVSRDHLLFEASFQTQPTLKVVYSCKLLR